MATARTRANMKPGVRSILSGLVIALSLAFFIYPAITLCVLLADSHLKQTGESRLVPRWFHSAAQKYASWSQGYLESDYAKSIDLNDVAATEWPMFGSVFFLVTAEELHKRGKIDASKGAIRDAVNRAAQIIASPTTATWVIARWGDRYLEQENVFYRMLLILGLSSYESLTGNTKYHPLMSLQRATLAKELAEASLHMRDDYPNECYPTDVLWAVAAIQRAARLEQTQHDELSASLLAALDGPLRAKEGLPAFEVESRSGQILQGARGCGNSGILLFAAELDAEVAKRWYSAYEALFWKDTGWIVGYTELPRGSDEHFADVDSGPVLLEFGSVASAFAIGAAKGVGRIDHAAPLTLEAVACAWPTPFGMLTPGLMGHLAADSWCLGEVALLFSMTRPTYAATRTPFDGPTPLIVWGLLFTYAGIGLLLIGIEIRSWPCLRALRRPPHPPQPRRPGA